MKINKFQFITIYRANCYEDAASAAAAAAAAAAADTGDGSGSSTGGGSSTDGGSGASGAEGGAKNKTFTQDEVNKLLAEDKRKHQERVNKTVKDLETLKTSNNLTAKEKGDLQKRIEDLQSEVLTKEQLAAKEKEKLSKTYQKQIEEANRERDTWKNRFTHSTINQQLTSAAATNEAFDPEQIIALLRPSTDLIEEVGEDKNPTGNFMPKVKFDDQDETGKKVTLTLTPEEAVKRMKDIPRFANLFKSTASGGLGGSQSAARGGKVGTPKDPAEYRKNRKAILEQ